MPFQPTLLIAGILYCSTFLVFSPAFANPAESSDVQKQIRKLLSGPENQIQLSEVLLLVSQHWRPTLDANPLNSTLDALTLSAKNALASKTTAQDKVTALRELIHQTSGYRYTDMVSPQGIPLNPEELFLHGLLQTRRGYCMNLSLLYLILAERLDLPLFGVPLPNHFFVRYESGNDRINIESTQQGQSFPDRFYQQRFMQSSSNDSQDYFLSNLGKKKTLGAYFSNVGMVFYRASRPKEAIFYLKLSTRINPSAIDAANNLANIYSDQKDYGRAIELYQRALKADPNNLSTLFNLGIAYAEAGKTKKAIEAFLQVVQINPAYARGHNALVRLFMEKKMYYSALVHLTALSDLEPNNLTRFLQIANVYFQLKQFDVALSSLMETQSRFPLRLEVNEMIAEAHYRLEQYKKAVVQYEFIIERRPQNQQSYMQLGWTHYKLNQIDQAVEWTQKGLSAGNDKKMILLGNMNMGFFHVLMKQFDKAETWYQKALDEKDPTALTAMTQDLTDASKELKGKPELDFYVGWLHAQSDKKDSARSYLKQFLKKHPQSSFTEKARELLKTLGEHSSTEIPADMVQVPKGLFLMGSNDHGDDEAPEHSVYLDEFYMDRFEVSAEQYSEFLNTLDGSQNIKKFFIINDGATIEFDGRRFNPRKGFENYPANSVTWFGASSFCKWKDKRLPTEAEWEKAARGTEGHLFPWGNEAPTQDRARFLQSWTEGPRQGVMVPVESMPEGKSPFGAFHMLGNVKEWVDDWYDREYYKEQEHKVNPKGQIGGEFKVLKGGSWRDLRTFIYSSFRNNGFPDMGNDDYGFRCARDGNSGSKPGRMTEQAPGEIIPVSGNAIKTQHDWRN